MDIVIGPVLKHPEGYRFDVWSVAKGVTRGYPYRRIEDAYYARNAEIRASVRGRAPSNLAFLVTAHGKPFAAAGFGNLFREWCDEAGLRQCSSQAYDLGEAVNSRMRVSSVTQCSTLPTTQVCAMRRDAGAGVLVTRHREGRELCCRL